jgi:hypothetical protein
MVILAAMLFLFFMGGILAPLELLKSIGSPAQMNIPSYFTRGQADGHGYTTRFDQQQGHAADGFTATRTVRSPAE